MLRNAKYSLFNSSSSNDPFINLGKSKGKGNWSGNNQKAKDKKGENKQQEIFSPQVKEILKNVGLSILAIVMFGIAYFLLRSKFRGE